MTEHGDTVLRVCRAVLGAHTDADDAWSETFLAALGAWPTLPLSANVEAWLVTIAHRKAIDITRARSRHAIPVGELPERASTRGIPDGGSLDLWAALATLPHKQRLAVAYHHLGGLPYRDVAELVGGSTDAARRAAADGMTSLRAILVEPAAAPRPAAAPPAAPPPGTHRSASSTATPTAFPSEETA